MAVVVDTSKKGIRVSQLSFAYPGGQKVLDKVSFEVLSGSRVLLAGATGSGKSTLLRCLKPELTPQGECTGEISLDGLNAQEFNPQFSAGHIGFVMQDPRQQIVMDTVKAELAFGLENLGIPQEMIQRRVAEIANYFGINDWVDRNTADLSGGETQMVNLAAVIAMQPRTLLLDEPTAMLDPIAAREFIELVRRVNDELGISIVLVEHHQEDLLGIMNQVFFLDEGRLAFNGRSREFAAWLQSSKKSHVRALPVATQLYFKQVKSHEIAQEDIPLDVREGRWWLWQHKEQTQASLCPAASSAQINESESAKGAQKSKNTSIVLEAKHVWYRYAKETPYILKDLSLQVTEGSILGIVGANASGKSTLLALLSGVHKPQHGKIKQAASLQFGLLPQDPTALFLRDTLVEDLMDHASDCHYGQAEVDAMLLKMGLEAKKQQHPLDLSGGEQQKLALAKLLLSNPDVLLLDEPTKGLDSEALLELNTLLKDESHKGKTIIMVSHNLEFVAATADECLMIFDGAPVGRASVKEFFMGNMFYTTALQRIVQGIIDDCPPVLDWSVNERQDPRSADEDKRSAYLEAAPIDGAHTR